MFATVGGDRLLALDMHVTELSFRAPNTAREERLWGLAYVM